MSRATLDLITMLGRRIDGTPGLLVLTYRNEDLDADHRLRLVVGDLPPHAVERTVLAPLSRATLASTDDVAVHPSHIRVPGLATMRARRRTAHERDHLMTESTDQFPATTDADPEVQGAWAYERLHVDAVFRQWAGPVLDAAGLTTGAKALDVACGTGVVARAAHGRVGPTGSVTGLDIGPGMLAVAEDIEPGVRWIEGDAGRLPFENDTFDAVVCQFGLMFFPDRVTAIREMLRCAKPGAPVVVAVWDALERSEAYPISVDLLDRRAGPAAADALRAPFVLGDTDELRGLFDEAGASAVSIDTQFGTARFPSVRSMLEADLTGWLPVMGVFLDDDLIESILSEADDELRRYVNENGEMVFDTPAHVVTAGA